MFIPAALHEFNIVGSENDGDVVSPFIILLRNSLTIYLTIV